MGPRLVTLDEIDYNELTMVARVNGQVVAEDTSSDLYHNFPKVFAHISQEQQFHPGDFSGSDTTPHGTAQASGLKRWLRPGDVVEMEIKRIGTIRNQVVKRSG